MRRITFALICALAITPGCQVVAQDTIPSNITPSNSTGDLPYSTSVGTALEHVDLATGNLVVEIPFTSVPGRSMTFDYGIRYDARFWVFNTIAGQMHWNPEQRNWLTSSTLGWTSTQGYLTFTRQQVTCTSSEAGPDFKIVPGGISTISGYASGTTASGYLFTDRHGVKHALAVNQLHVSCDDGTSFDTSNYVGPASAMDGYFAGFTIPSAVPTIQAADGTTYTAGGSSGGTSQPTLGLWFQDFSQETDLRGNTQLVAPGGKDSIGRALLTEQISGSDLIYTVYDSNGSPQTYKVTLESIPISTSFGNPNIVEYSGTRQVVKSVTLPNTLSYSFVYDSFGSITQLTTPAGAVINYEWSSIEVPNSVRSYSVRAVSRRSVTHDGQTDVWDFHYAEGSPTNDPTVPIFTVTVDPPSDEYGVRGEDIYKYGSSSELLQVQRLSSAGGKVLRQYDLTWYQTQTGNPTGLVTSIKTTLDNGLVSLKNFQYDLYSYPVQQEDCSATQVLLNCYNMAESGQVGPPTYAEPLVAFAGTHGNVTTIQEYDWGQGSPGPLVRQTLRTYIADSNPSYFIASPNTTGMNNGAKPIRNITNRAVSESIFDGTIPCTATGTWNASTATITPPPTCDARLLSQRTVKYDLGSPSTYGYYGEPTSVSRWLNVPTSTTLTTQYSYDAYGNLHTVTDPRGNTTTYGYEDAWYGSGSCGATSPANAYVTSVTDALSHTIKSSYYQCSGKPGLVQSANDVASNVGRGTTYSYDWDGRRLSVSTPDGGETTSTYDDSARTVDTVNEGNAGPKIETLTQMDNLNRAINSQVISVPQSIVASQVSYDALGRKYQEWNPYYTTADTSVVRHK